MFFRSHTHVNPIYLVVVGFLIGVLGGIFGVGGSFIAGPALRSLGLTGTLPLAPIGPHRRNLWWRRSVTARSATSIAPGLIMQWARSAARKWARKLIQMLKRAGNVNFVVSVVSIVIYLSISTFMFWESWKTLAHSKRQNPQRKSITRGGKSTNRRSTM